MNQKTSIERPIRFHKLFVGSKFRIFAEPSREIRKSNDKTVWLKEAESYSVAVDEPERAAILMPEDLVIPLSRGA